MKSDFLLAFNEIAETRKLPREIVMEALSAALVSAYRRDTGLPNTHEVEVRFDEKSGTPSIWSARTVVDEVADPVTEVSLDEANRLEPDAALGDEIMVDSTPDGFGRIAAQTAKQVILQRMREAERDAQYQEYMERIGDLVTGTVQNDNGDVVTVSLGRTEAILPRSQQMPGERYEMHEKVRAFVMEVRRTNRGPQIVISRTHKSMLRRLLEYEVPEIYNGTVEIKSIAREPGARSKVAVYSNQPGADPVGACVGMRGIRIQSIVKELNDEKIDVIEWNPEQEVFISKSLSPARVSAVFLDDDPDEGRTATVIVPDDQLSLAIGREGQNARLSAKLTGWRIDIKSISEAAQEAYEHLQTEEEIAFIAEQRPDLVEQVAGILERKANDRPVTAEDYAVLVEFVKQVEGYRLDLRNVEREGRRAEIADARARVAEASYEVPLDVTDLPLSAYRMLERGGFENVGQVLEQFYVDRSHFRTLDGFRPHIMDSLKTFVENFDLDEYIEQIEEAAEAAEQEEEHIEEAAPEAAAPVEDAAVEETEPVAEVVEAPPAEPQPAEEEPEEPEVGYIHEDELARKRRAELVSRLSDVDLGLGVEGESVYDDQYEEEEPEEVPEPVSAGEHGASESGELGEDGEELDEEELERRRDRQRRRQLVYDEDLGRVVAKRRRKGGRAKNRWEDFTMEDYEDYMEDFDYYDEDEDEDDDE